MSMYSLDRFLDECKAITARHHEPSSLVRNLAPLMKQLLATDRSFLRPEHFKSHPDHYNRNAIYVHDESEISLFSMVWLPGQWTPVHDHSSWGVVGVVEGMLEERSYCCSGPITEDANIHLRSGSVVLLDTGSVTTFIPEPDHIHVSGVPEDRPRAVSLHLYGRNMHNFHVYDVDRGTRALVEVACDVSEPPR